MDNKGSWKKSRDRLVSSLTALGYPEELGDVIAKHIGSPKGIERMISYLNNVRPDKFELIADEMICIKDEIDTWRDRKASQHANSVYNEMLNHGTGTGDEEWRYHGYRKITRKKGAFSFING
ncbi:MAG: hypothetical protein II773_12305 [Oscillospiraceae bacterium]|nr:hypothetical protein [Oscillospiraceae bacterium]